MLTFLLTVVIMIMIIITIYITIVTGIIIFIISNIFIIFIIIIIFFNVTVLSKSFIVMIIIPSLLSMQNRFRKSNKTEKHKYLLKLKMVKNPLQSIHQIFLKRIESIRNRQICGDPWTTAYTHIITWHILMNIIWIMKLYTAVSVV